MKRIAFTCIVAMTLCGLVAIPAVLAQENHNHAEYHHYKLVDMGTFGGVISSINFAGDAGNAAVNQRGVTVGFSATSTPKLPTSNPFICGGDDGFGSFVTHAFRWQDGTVADLGALAPTETDCSNAYRVNASGEIVGFSENGEVDPLSGFNEARAVRWKDGEIQDLGTLGGNESLAVAINDRGQIVGFSLNLIADPYSLLDNFLGSSNGTQTRAFLWQNGQVQDLGTMGTGNDAAALFINEHAQVAGYGYTSSIPNPVTGIPPIDPFFWEKGKMTDVGGLGGAVGMPNFLNNRGQVVGVSSVAANPAACFTESDPNCHPFLWSQGELIDLKTTTIGGAPITVNGINDAGQIVGGGDFSSSGGSSFDSYLWENGVATDLGHLNGDCFSQAFTINSDGLVGGNSFSCDGNFHHAFLWQDGGSIIDLNSLIPADSPLQVVTVNDLSDKGEIAGDGVPLGVDPNNVFTQGHAYLLIPCDEQHPGIEGCDYSMVDATAATALTTSRSVSNSQNAAAGMRRFQSMSNRMLRRFGGRVK